MKDGTRRDYVWNTVGVLAQNAVSPILLILVTRINGVVDSGIFSYAMAVAFIFWAFSIWGGRTYQVSDLKQEFSGHGYVLVRVILGLTVIIGAAIFCLLNNYDAQKVSMILMLTALKVVESVSDAVYGVMQINNRLFIVGRSLLIKSFAGTAAFLLVEAMTRNLVLSSFAFLAAVCVVFVTYDLYHARAQDYYISRAFNDISSTFREAIAIIIRCSPVAAVIFLSIFSLNIPRYFLDRYHQNEIGYFGILAMPITVLALVITFLLQPKIIQLTALFTNKDFDALNRETRKLISLVLAIGVIGVIAAYLFGVEIMQVVFGLDFAEYLAPLMIFILGAIAGGIVSVYMNLFTIIRHFKSLFFTFLITNVALALISLIVIKDWGLIGSAILYSLVNVVQIIVLAVSYKIIINKHMLEVASHS